MALQKRTTARTAEPAASTIPAPTGELAVQPTVEVDGEGNAINTGDNNSAPAPAAAPLSPDADENLAEERPVEELPVQPAPEAPLSRDAEENSDAALKEAEEAALAEQAEIKRLADLKAEDDLKADAALKASEATKEEGHKKGSLVLVKNVSSQAQRQYSTGLWIGSGDTSELKYDGWLRNQLNAKILVEVKD